jgi:putative ABC transport system permease protein
MWGWRRRSDDDFREEIQANLALDTDRFIDEGLNHEEARAAARRAFGNVTHAHERRFYESRRVRWLDQCWRDLRSALRGLRAAPVYCAVAIASLTLGIGANTAVFSVVNAVLLRPLPYPAADRLVLLGYTFSGASAPFVSETKLNVWREQRVAWQDVGAVRERRVNVRDGTRVEQVVALQTNTAFFPVIGAQAALGRTFNADEDRPGGDRVVLLSDGFWKRRFGSDLHVVGTRLEVDGEIATIVGVLSGTTDTAIFKLTPDLWMPLQLDPHSLEHIPSLMAGARLAPGVTLAMAREQARLAGDEFHRRFPQASGPQDTFTVTPLQEGLVGDVRPSLRVLMGAVACVLLIACANVANLMLIRGSVRQREIAIRAAIGASRWQIVRQFTAESLMLAFVGGSLGLAVGTVGIRALLALNPADLPRIGAHAVGVTADGRVLSFAVTLTVITGLVCGLWPAWLVSGGNRGPLHLPTGGRVGATRFEHRVRSLLVVGEVALALVLLIGATLFIRTFAALNAVDRGFNPRHVLTLRVALTDQRFTKTDVVGRLVSATTQRLEALTDVVGAAATRTLPLESDWRTSLQIVGRPVGGSSPVVVSYRIISPGYFNVLGIPIVRGRAVAVRDDTSAPAIALINQAMARRFWPDGNPLDDRIIVFPGLVPDDEPARQIVGIVGDVRDGMPLDQEERPVVYVPLTQLLDRESAVQRPASLAWVVRTRRQTSAIARSIERELSEASGGAPVASVSSLDEIATQAIAPTTFSMTVLTLFGACALLLAAVGIYGVLGYAVEQRTYEIGVRLALGASWNQVRNMVLRNGFILASSGIVLGGAAAAALAGALSTFLFGMHPHDIPTFTTAPLLLCGVSLAAVWFPARRASRIDPAEVLRRG